MVDSKKRWAQPPYQQKAVRIVVHFLLTGIALLFGRRLVVAVAVVVVVVVIVVIVIIVVIVVAAKDRGAPRVEQAPCRDCLQPHPADRIHHTVDTQCEHVDQSED